jgi:hypothetical protein
MVVVVVHLLPFLGFLGNDYTQRRHVKVGVDPDANAPAKSLLTVSLLHSVLKQDFNDALVEFV